MTEQGPYKMRTIARLTDFSPAVLRAWERRHNLLEPLRGPGGHRLYTEDDLKVLRRVRELIQQGRSIGEIAGFGRQALLGVNVAEPAANAPLPPLQDPPSEEIRDELTRWRKAVVDAALEMDSGRINRALDEAFSRVSAETAIFEVIQAGAREIGDLWMAGRCSVASEHLASGIFVHRLRKLVESAEPARSEWAPIVVACFPDEYHQLGALIVAHQLCRHGMRVSFLGAALPFEDLDGACDVMSPGAVLLSVTRDAVYQIHRRALLDTLRKRAPKLPFFIGGQGAPANDAAIEKAGARLVAAKGDPHEALQQVMTEVQNARRRIFS